MRGALPLLLVAALAAGGAPQSPSADVGGLIRQLQSTDPWTRETARHALLKTTDPAALSPLLAALEAGDADQRSVPVILETLANFTDARKIPALVARARSSDLLRDEVASQMQVLGQPAVQALESEIATCGAMTRWDAYRGWAAGVLCDMDEPGVEALLRLFHSKTACRRAYAVAGMEQAADTPRAAQSIRLAIEDRDWWVRSAALGVVDSLLGPENGPEADFDYGSLVGPLTRRLRANDDRLEIIEVLERIGDKRAVPAIRSLLRDEDEEVRDAAGRALKTLARPRDPLQKAARQLASGDPDVRVAGIEALADAETNETGRVVPLLHDRSAGVRKAAADALGDINHMPRDPKDENDRDLASVPPLIAALQDPAPEVRAAAAEALGLIEDRRAVAPLIASLHDAEARVVDAAIVALTSLRDPAAGGPLADLYRASDRARRRNVLIALSMVCDPATMPVLVDALHDPQLAEAAAGAIGEVMDKGPVPGAADGLLEALAVDPHPSYAFFNAVGKTRDPRAIPLLAKVAAEAPEASAVRGWAFLALGNIGHSSAYPVLVAGLRDRDSRNRGEALAALAKLESFAVTPEMIDALVDEDPAVREWAAAALVRSRDPHALPPLVRAMKNDGRAAIMALGETKSREAVEPLVEYLADARNAAELRALAARSLGNLGDARAVPALRAFEAELSGAARQSPLLDLVREALKKLERQ